MNKGFEETKKVLWNKLQNKENFFFVRFGDGDLHLMSGHPGEQRHKNSPELQKELIEAISIEDSRFLKASTAYSYNDGTNSYFWINGEENKRRFDLNLIKIQERFSPSKQLYHALAIQHSFEVDIKWVINWLKFLKDRKVLLIAGDALCGKELVKKAYNINKEISFPGTTDAYYHLSEKMDEIREAVAVHDVVIPVIGMATRVVAKRLFKEFAYSKTLIDMGVTTDALAEVPHRGWTQTIIDRGLVEKCKEAFLNG
jgi:hypothetical protein